MRLTKRRDRILIQPEIFNGYCNNAVDFKALIFFYYCKSKFKNSQIYNYTPNRLSSITKLSPNTVRKYIGILKKNNLVKKIGSNMIFINPYKIINSSQKKVSIDVLPWTSYKHFFNRILATLIKRNQLQQSWVLKYRQIASGKDTKNFAIGDYNKYIKHYSHKYPDGDSTKIDNFVHQSSKQLAKLFNINQRTMINWLHNLSDIGYINTKEIIERCSYSIKCKYIPLYSYYYNEVLYIHHGSIYKITI